jgi:hypothetical protein
VYTLYIYWQFYCQGHDSAPGIDIMLLKQQYLSVSGQAADLARQHPPVEYVCLRWVRVAVWQEIVAGWGEAPASRGRPLRVCGQDWADPKEVPVQGFQARMGN